MPYQGWKLWLWLALGDGSTRTDTANLENQLSQHRKINVSAILGSRAFEQISGEEVSVSLTIGRRIAMADEAILIDANRSSRSEKIEEIRVWPHLTVVDYSGKQSQWLFNFCKCHVDWHFVGARKVRQWHPNFRLSTLRPTFLGSFFISSDLGVHAIHDWRNHARCGAGEYHQMGAG